MVETKVNDIKEDFRFQGTNRVLLKWLKLWDQVVFDKQPEDRKKKMKVHTTKTHKFSDQNNNKNGNFVKKQFNIEDDLVCSTET